MACRLPRRASGLLGRDVCGQMMVEMAVTIPVLLAVVGITINLLVFLGDCAAFDRLAAEAVRTQAASPAFGSYELAWRAEQVEQVLNDSLYDRPWLSFEVRAQDHALIGGGETGASGGDGPGTGRGEGTIFSFFPHQEEFICVMRYRPWGLGDSFFGIHFSGIEHTRTYCIDPYRPGVLL